MKKRLIIFALCVFCLASAYSQSTFQLGPMASMPLGSFDEFEEQLKDTDSYRVGADFRLSLDHFQLGVNALAGGFSEDDFFFDTVVSLNYIFLPKSIVNVSAGVGVGFDANYDGSSWSIGGNKEGDIGGILLSSSLVYNVGVNFSLFGLGLSVKYAAPTEEVFDDMRDVCDILPNLDEGRLSLSVLFGLL